MINQLSNPINRNRSAAKISKFMSSIDYTEKKVSARAGNLRDRGSPVDLYCSHQIEAEVDFSQIILQKFSRKDNFRCETTLNIILLLPSSV